MKIRCVWEHNGSDTILYSDNFIGAFTRGKALEIALEKMQQEVISYIKWCGEEIPDVFTTEIIQEKSSELQICDADSDIIFEEEKKPLTEKEYATLKKLALKSAEDFLLLYSMISDKNKSNLPMRKTFYGDVPRTAQEMYEHTKNVNSYYFGEIGIEIDNSGSILDCRRRGFKILENKERYLNNDVFEGSYNEQWSLRKMLRRFIWHDRIHAKAMYRMALKTFGENSVPNIFMFDI
ncbi:hypothetical protein [Desnuesiella massiliensis]|uniref:hypothetical protein n=1 Tax=Desnuesiella massiliensis TaxID=1650662 RepID=UPI0006E29628|nr:hypothetical protein [Desnuesiella massiliensis]